MSLQQHEVLSKNNLSCLEIDECASGPFLHLLRSHQMTDLPPETQQPVDTSYGLFLTSPCDGLKSTFHQMPVQWVGTAPENCPEFPSLLARDPVRAVGTTISLQSGLAAQGD